jgi:putative hemolysin
MDDPFPPLILFSLIIVSGFCSFTGRALGLARRPKLRLKAASAGKVRILEAAEKPETIVFSLRIWNLLARLAAGALGVLLFPGFPPVRTIIILALVFIVCSEFLPRLLAAANPEGILIVLFPLLSVLSKPWKPLCMLASRFFKNGTSTPGEEEFLMALEEGEKTGAVESKERSMVEGVLYLGDRPVSAFMTHRSEIEWLDIDAGMEEVREKALIYRTQGFFPVIRGTQDDIAGIVSVQDILIALTGIRPAQDNSGEWKGLQAIMKKPRFIPETLSALKAFEAFKKEDEYYLCVMDEYGGFAGSLRFRDLIEEIVGGLSGSPPEEDPVILQEDGTWLAGGSVSMDELAKVPGLEDLEKQGSPGAPFRGTPDYHTLAGFILKLAGDIPRTGESFVWENYRFTVLDLDGNRIDKVLISKAAVSKTAT